MELKKRMDRHIMQGASGRASCQEQGGSIMVTGREILKIVGIAGLTLFIGQGCSQKSVRVTADSETFDQGAQYADNQANPFAQGYQPFGSWQGGAGMGINKEQGKIIMVPARVHRTLTQRGQLKCILTAKLKVKEVHKQGNLVARKVGLPTLGTILRLGLIPAHLPVFRNMGAGVEELGDQAKGIKMAKVETWRKSLSNRTMTILPKPNGFLLVGWPRMLRVVNPHGCKWNCKMCFLNSIAGEFRKREGKP